MLDEKELDLKVIEDRQSILIKEMTVRITNAEKRNLQLWDENKQIKKGE